MIETPHPPSECLECELLLNDVIISIREPRLP